MAAQTFDSIRKSLARGEIAPVYYLGGEDELRKDELIAEILDRAVEPATRDFNLDVRGAADVDAESLHALIETPPMLAARRGVVIRGVDQWRKNAKTWDVLHRYLAHPSATTVLILVQGGGEPLDAAVAAKARCGESGVLEREDLIAWVATRASQQRLALAPDAAAHLVDTVGSDTAQLAAELDKLGAAWGDRAVTADDVAQMVGVRHGETATDWVEAVLRRDTKRAVGLLDVVLPQSGVSAVKLVAVLGTNLVALRLARGLLDERTPPGRLAGRLLQELREIRPRLEGSWSALASTWAAAAPQWNAADVDAALCAAYEADRRLKSTGVTDERGTLTHLVLGLALRSAAA